MPQDQESSNRQTQPAAEEVWEELNAANKLLIEAFSTLSSSEDEEEEKKIALSSIKASYIPLVRRWFARMGKEATVHTEPPSQTRLAPVTNIRAIDTPATDA